MFFHFTYLHMHLLQINCAIIVDVQHTFRFDLDLIADPGQCHKDTSFSTCLLCGRWYFVSSTQPKWLHIFAHTWCQSVAQSLWMCNTPFLLTLLVFLHTSRYDGHYFVYSNCSTYFHIFCASQLNDHCRCATFCFDHDHFADSGQGHIQQQISLNFRARGT